MGNMTAYDAIKNSVESMTPRYFHGVMRKTRPQYPLFFRSTIFNGPDILTDREVMFWHEISDNNPQFVPPVVFPCDDFDYVQDNESFTERYAKFPYVQLGATVDCDFTQYLGAGEFVDNAQGLGSAIEEAFTRRSMSVDRSFVYLEDLWAAQAVIDQKITIQGKGIKPYDIEFKRCDTLNRTLEGKEVWGEKGSDNPLKPIEEMDNLMFCKNGGTTNNIIMSQGTFDKLMCSPAIQNCLKTFDPNLFVPGIISSGQTNLEPEAPYVGAKNVLRMNRDGRTLNFWVVRAYYDFLNPATGQKVKKDLLPLGKVIGFNLGTGDNQYGARYAYGGIKNMHAGNERRMQMFSRGYVPENGKGMKYEAESAPMPIIFCPDASWCIQVCPEGEVIEG